MKNIILISALLVSSLTAFAQNIDHGNIQDFKINNTITFFSRKSDIINEFGALTGKAARLITEYWEIEDLTMRVLTYSGGKFVVHNTTDGDLTRFEITGPSYSLFYGSHEIKLGDNLNTLSSLFPNSYANKGSNGADKYLMRIGLKYVHGSETAYLEGQI